MHISWVDVTKGRLHQTSLVWQTLQREVLSAPSWKQITARPLLFLYVFPLWLIELRQNQSSGEEKTRSSRTNRTHRKALVKFIVGYIIWASEVNFSFPKFNEWIYFTRPTDGPLVPIQKVAGFRDFWRWLFAWRKYRFKSPPSSGSLGSFQRFLFSSEFLSCFKTHDGVILCTMIIYI